MTLPAFVTSLPESTRQFLGSFFQKKSGPRAQQSPAAHANSFSPDDKNTPSLTSPSYYSLPPSPSPYSFSDNDTLTGNSSNLSLVTPSSSSTINNCHHYNSNNNNNQYGSNSSSSHRHTGSPLKESTSVLQPLLLPPRRSSIVTINSPVSNDAAWPVDSSSPPTKPGTTPPHGQHSATDTDKPTCGTLHSNNNSEPMSLIVSGNKDTATDNVVALDRLEFTSPTLPLSPSSMRRKFEHFTFRRGSAASVAVALAAGLDGGASNRGSGAGDVGGAGNGVGGGSSSSTGSILSSLVSTFKKHSTNNSQKQEQQPQHLQQQEQQKPQPQHPQRLTLKSHRSHNFFINGRKKDPVGPSTLATATVIKRTPSPSLSTSPTLPEISPLQAVRPIPTTASTTTASTTTTTATTTTTTSTTTTTTTGTTTAASMTSPHLHPSSNAVSTNSRGETVMTITTNDRRLSCTPSTTATLIPPQLKNNKQALSSTTIQTTWSKLPEVVRICNLPEYFPDDSFGRNAERNEKYARTRLVALREHQQILVGFLGHLMVIEQHQRSGEQLFAAFIDPSFSGNNSTLAASSPTEKATAAPKATTAAETTKVSRADSRSDPTAAMVVRESESSCVCQKRHHRRLQKRDAAIRAYQRAILDLWQTDQNMCYWLSRYIRTTRHIGRGLEYMVAAMPESHNNINNNKHSTSPPPFKYPPYWCMTKEIDDLSFVGVGVPWNGRPTSGVSNPELERMGILQSKLMNYSTASNSFVSDGGCSAIEGRSNGEPPRRPVALPDSSTLGDLHIQFSLVSQSVSMQELTKSLPRPQLIWSSEQHTIPTIRINSPELLFKPLPKLLNNTSGVDLDSSASFPALSCRSSFGSTTSATSMTSMTDNATVVTAITATTGFSDTTANTANNNDDGIRMVFISGRILPIFSTPLLSAAIRELVTSSAPITPPPAVPAPKRPRRPTFPILPPPPDRTRANVKIASTAFFPSVPSPSVSTLFPGSQTCTSTTVAALTWDAADAKLSSSTSSAASIRAPIHEFNPVDHRQDVHPFDSVPILSTSAKDTVFSSMNDLETDDHSATQPGMTFPAPTATAATMAATTTPAKKSTKAPPNNATTLQKIPHEYFEDDDINEIEASVVIGYHLQSLGKANEFLFQFNKESRRSFGVLKRFEVARQVFERRVLCQYAGDGDGGGNDEYDSESEVGEERA